MVDLSQSLSHIRDLADSKDEYLKNLEKIRNALEDQHLSRNHDYSFGEDGKDFVPGSWTPRSTLHTVKSVIIFYFIKL